MIEDESCEQTFPIYKGQLKEGQRHGYGIEFDITKDGQVFRKVEGTWKDGRKHHVIEKSDPNTLVYYGEYNEEGKRHGKGVEYEKGITKFKGTFHHGEHDTGTLYLEWLKNRTFKGKWEGEIFEGQVLDKEIVGECLVTYKAILYKNSEAVMCKFDGGKFRRVQEDRWKGWYKQGSKIVFGYFKRIELVPYQRFSVLHLQRDNNAWIEDKGEFSVEYWEHSVLKMKTKLVKSMNNEEVLNWLNGITSEPLPPQKTMEFLQVKASIKKSVKERNLSGALLMQLLTELRSTSKLPRSHFDFIMKLFRSDSEMYWDPMILFAKELKIFHKLWLGRKVLWAAIKKNDPSYCPMAVLPGELIKYLIQLLN